jgi:hypothetical protein
MRIKHGETAHVGWMPYRFAAVLTAIGAALVYGTAPAIAEASRQPSVLSNQLAGGCAVLGIAVYSWIALVVVASLGEHLGGSAGRLARSCALLVAPAGWRNSVRLACGAAAVAVPAAGLVGTQASAAAVTSSAPDHAIVSMADRSKQPGGIRLDGLPMPDRPAGTPLVARGRPRLTIVRPGDTLWQIAARHLGPAPTEAQVAADWPRWYAANRSVIGDDPGFITPGTVLQAPAGMRGESR